MSSGCHVASQYVNVHNLCDPYLAIFIVECELDHDDLHHNVFFSKLGT